MKRLQAWLRDPHNRRRFIFGAAAAAVVVLLFLRRSGSGAATAATTTADVGPLVDPSSLTNGVPNALDGSGGTGGVTATSPNDIANLTDELANLQDAVGSLGDRLDTGGDTATAPTDAGTATSAPSAKAAVPAPGFWWNIGGKKTYVTLKNKAAFLAELRKHGSSVATWAANHPEAARAIGITPPPRPPKAKPGGSSPARELGGAARTAPKSKAAPATPRLSLPAPVAAVVTRVTAPAAAPTAPVAVPAAVSHLLTTIRPVSIPTLLPKLTPVIRPRLSVRGGLDI